MPSNDILVKTINVKDPIPNIIPQIKDIVLFILNFLPKQLKFQQS